MKEQVGDLWTWPADVRIVPTNGTVTTAGNAVMGAGIALQAAKRFPMLPHDLGVKIRKFGNHVHYFDVYQLLTFPTKHDWRHDGDLDLIEEMVQELKTFINPDKRYVMPRIGTGLGRLDWTSEIRPLLSTLPGNVTVLTWHL